MVRMLGRLSENAFRWSVVLFVAAAAVGVCWGWLILTYGMWEGWPVPAAVRYNSHVLVWGSLLIVNLLLSFVQPKIGFRWLRRRTRPKRRLGHLTYGANA